MKTVVFACTLAALAMAQDDYWLGPRPYTFASPPCGFARHRYEGVTLAESLHSYNVRHYRLDIDLPMTDSSYSCHEWLSIRSDVASLDSFTLDFCNLVCDSVKRNGQSLSFLVPTNYLTIMLDTPLTQGDSTVIDIFFRHTGAGPRLGYYYAEPPYTAYAYCHTCTPPRDCRYWMACFDEPGDKAERGVDLNLTVPDSFQTCANGELDSVTYSAGKATYWWRHPYAIATYLITFSASRFCEWEQQLAAGNGDTVPSRYFIWPQDSSRSIYAFRNIPAMMRYFSDTLIYGAYPFERYGMTVGYNSFPWGGMENQTLVMINGAWLNGGDDIGLAHEMSHMWYGDMVTCVDFRDVWLNEGFGTYSECMYYGHSTSRAHFKSYVAGRGRVALQQDRAYRFAIYDPPEAQIYNYGTIYCKGACVLHMLRYVMGDTAWEQPGVFFRALRVYGDSFRYGTASTADYQRINEQLSGLDLSWFFDDWVYQAGIPRYNLNWRREPAGDSFRVIMTLSQNNGANAPNCFRMPIPVRVNCGAERQFVTLRPQANPETDTFVVAAWPDSLSWDPDDWVLDSVAVTGIEEDPSPKLQVPIAVRSSPARGIVRFELPAGQVKSVAVYDESGREAAVLNAGSRSEVAWRPGRAGVYFAQAKGSGLRTRFVVVE